MPLSFGTTPSQVSLFRHLADPKQVSQDTLRELKYKSAKKAKESQLSFGERGGQSYASRVTQNGKSNFRPQSYAVPSGSDRRREDRNERIDHIEHHGQRIEEEDACDQGAAREMEEEESFVDAREDHHTLPQESSFPRNSSGLTYEMEKSQVQTMIDSEVDREKEQFLSELRKYRGQTTREFTMQDTLTDIQFEYDRLKGGENAANVVRIMGIVLQVVVYAVQWGNSKFGPLLKLDNGETSWAMQTGESIGNHEYDSVLEKLYRKHWRKGSMSPEAELGMMLIGSAGVFHFQTHVNEKLSKRSSDSSKKGGGGGFNLMDLVGPVMGLVGGGGIGASGNNTSRPLPPAADPVPPKRFDFVAGRPAQAPPSFPQPAPFAQGPSTGYTQPQGPSTGFPQGPSPGFPQGPSPGFPQGPPQGPQGIPQGYSQAPGPNLVEMEQQFAKRQQEMLNRMDEVTRRADEQMRASQARQLDLERQLQQTQMRLHQMQSYAQQQHHQQQLQLQQQRQQFLQQQQVQQQQPRTVPEFQQRNFAAAVNTPLPAPTVEEHEAPSPPLSPLVELSDGDNGDNADLGDDGEQEVDTKFDVKEVMVTEKQRRKRAPVQLEIDELSLAL